ncbi:class I SAM-dependent methyltransferase [Streptacidiphilus anmyonensis]|uniref:class I SAM-dependent methyltransferase n=1 Tax=Streptacidiphilus anmyonensis TaxID=405782 RepID=UPI0005A95B28|nr:class I SAM-dependent methyltransferase [Streptacidiphilus anmyonensis]
MVQAFEIKGNDLWDPTTFDALRRQLIPSFDLIYEAAVRAVAATAPANPTVLDLGAGTGLLSAAILRELPEATVTLVDRSELMLAQARSRFASQDGVTVQTGDLTDPLPEGQFDAVVSGLAIHHLSHADKRHLFRRIREALRPGGVFVNVEQVQGPLPHLESLYDSQHELHVAREQAPAHEWAAGRERMKFDNCIDLETQLQWLRDVGFRSVDCLAKDFRFATYAGWVSA